MKNTKATLKNKQLLSFMQDLLIQLGLNTAHDYDGIESNNDIFLYKKSIHREISEMHKTIYSLKRKYNNK